MHMHLLHVGTHVHATAPYNCTRSGSPHNVLHSSSLCMIAFSVMKCFRSCSSLIAGGGGGGGAPVCWYVVGSAPPHCVVVHIV